MVLSVEEVASRLGCSRRRVFQLLANGTLERAPRYGKQIRIYEDTVIAAQARPTSEQRKAAKRMPLAPVFDRSKVRVF